MTVAVARIRIAPGARLLDAPVPAPRAPQASNDEHAREAAVALSIDAMAIAAPDAPPVIVARADVSADYVATAAQLADLATLDQQLLEGARSPAQKAYLARYRLATLGGDYLLRVTRDGGDWLVTCPFERYAAPAIAGHVPPAIAIDGDLRVTLTYTAPAGSGTVQRSQEFQRVVVRADGLVATLRLAAVPDQDEIYAALTSPSAQARLTVWRAPRIGVLAPQPVPDADVRAAEIRALTAAPLAVLRMHAWSAKAAAPIGPVLLESMTGAAGFQRGDRLRVRSLDGTQCLVGSAPGTAFVPVGPAPAPQQQVVFCPLPAPWVSSALMSVLAEAFTDRMNNGPAGVAPAIAREQPLLMLPAPWTPPPAPSGWCSIDILPAAHPAQAARAALVARLRSELEARQREYATTWFTVRQPELPLDVPPQPFCLPPDLHPAVFTGVTPAGGRTGALRPINCGSHVYYEDLQQRQRVYYLPDRFELAPRTDAPWPHLRIRSAIDADVFLIEYVAAPVVENSRLQGDAAALLAEANRLAASPVSALEFEPLLGDTVSLTLMVPGRTGWTAQQRPATISDLYHAFTDVVTVDGAGLRLLFDALFAPGAAPFRGVVDVTLGGPSAPWAHHQIPLVAHVAGSREAFWDAAFDPVIAATRQRQIDVIADAALFGRSPSVAVAFERGGVVLLTAEVSRGSTNIAQPIGDYVLGAPDAGTYRYQLTGTDGGADFTSDWKTGAGSTLHLSSW